MKLRWEPITLNLKTTFRVAHGAFDQRVNVLVYLDDGVGEAGVELRRDLDAAPALGAGAPLGPKELRAAVRGGPLHLPAGRMLASKQ